jgi:hypothetical protein
MLLNDNDEDQFVAWLRRCCNVGFVRRGVR